MGPPGDQGRTGHNGRPGRFGFAGPAGQDGDKGSCAHCPGNRFNCECLLNNYIEWIVLAFKWNVFIVN